MPCEVSTFQLPGGARCVRVDVSGILTGDEANTAIGHLEPGGSYHGLSLMVCGQEMKSMTTEARAVFGNRRSPPPTEWMAIVLTNPILRVTSNFILRMNGNVRRRLFSTEREAVHWLDERVLENAAGTKGGAP
ncbi:MAG TPA: hypothetical protein VIG99_33490 [Myxococcaceae bacterium]